jgi:predicted regulator of Ras-like GTPase activity (Roadblock/LC7/MglB family)
MARPQSSKFIHYKQWQMDSLALGQLFLPAIEKMATRIPQLRCAVLCTPDGFNICSLGLTEDQVGKMAALSSSLLSVGNATVGSLAPEGEAAGTLDLLTMESDGLQIVTIKIPRPGGHLVLMAGARAPLGVVLVGVKATAADLLKLL